MPNPFQLQRVILPAGALRSGGPSFVGPLDALVAQGASLIAGFSNRRLASSYLGAPAILQSDDTGNPEASIPFDSIGNIDLSAVTALIGGGTVARYKTWHDQFSGGRDVTQATQANQPPFATSSVATGAVEIAVAGASLASASFAIAQPFTVFAVVKTASGGNRTILGHLDGATSVANTCRATTFGVMAGHYGINANGPTLTPGNLGLVRFYVNGAISHIYVNESGLTGLNTGANNPTGLRPFLSNVGANGFVGSCPELIVFSGDPSGLAGWNAFIAATQAYYGL